MAHLHGTLSGSASGQTCDSSRYLHIILSDGSGNKNEKLKSKNTGKYDWQQAMMS